MPTWREMPVVRRALVARALAVACAAGLAVQALAPAAAHAAPPVPPAPSAPPATTPVPAPKPAPPAKDSTPAPPAFTLPLDVGTKLVHDGQVARFALARWAPQLAKAKARTNEVQAHMNVVVANLRRLGAKARDTARRLEETRDHLRRAAASAYVHSGNSDLASAINTFIDAKSAVDMSRNMHIIDVYGQREQAALKRYLALKKSVDRQIRDVSAEHDRVNQQLTRAKATFADLDAKVKNARKQIRDSQLGVLLFHAAATSASSPILGP